MPRRCLPNKTPSTLLGAWNAPRLAIQQRGWLHATLRVLGAPQWADVVTAYEYKLGGQFIHTYQGHQAC